MAEAVAARQPAHTPADPQRAQPHAARQKSAAVRPGISRLQRAVGNRAMHQLLRSPRVQPKLTVGPADDEYEREAGLVADQMMRMPDPSPAATQTHASPSLQRACAGCQNGGTLCPHCEEERYGKPVVTAVQTLGSGRVSTHRPDDGSGEASTALTSYVRRSKGGGQPLPPSTRERFESRFGHDFGAVRLHTDQRAHEAAAEINALAFTAESDIHFASGAFRPDTVDGDRLIAHELVHTLQQGRARRLPTVQRTCHPGPIAAKVAGRASCIDRFDGTFVAGSLFKFKRDCDEFDGGQAAALAGLGAVLRPLTTTFEIHGFASVDGPVAFNQNLGCARGMEARRVLTDAPPAGAGIPPGRITGIVNHGPVPGPIADRRSVVVVTTTPAPPLPPPPPATATCTAPSNPDLSGRGFNPTTAGETRVCVTNPIDCNDAFDCRDTAFAAARSSGLSGAHLGPQDAFRHCVWSCCMTEEMGSASEAEQFGTAHENSNPSAILFDNDMDLHDNATGRAIGAAGGDCEAECRAAVSAGRLRTIRGPEADRSATREGVAPASPPVPTTCIGASDQPWP